MEGEPSCHVLTRYFIDMRRQEMSEFFGNVVRSASSAVQRVFVSTVTSITNFKAPPVASGMLGSFPGTAALQNFSSGLPRFFGSGGIAAGAQPATRAQPAAFFPGPTGMNGLPGPNIRSSLAPAPAMPAPPAWLTSLSQHQGFQPGMQPGQQFSALPVSLLGSPFSSPLPRAQASAPLGSSPIPFLRSSPALAAGMTMSMLTASGPHASSSLPTQATFPSSTPDPGATHVPETQEALPISPSEHTFTALFSPVWGTPHPDARNAVAPDKVVAVERSAPDLPAYFGADPDAEARKQIIDFFDKNFGNHDT
jgi:hypothetical protein